jgi:hypothetical protein
MDSCLDRAVGNVIVVLFSFFLAWGLRIATSTVRLEGRILPSEQLHFGKGYKEVVQPNADWGRTSMSKSVLTAINFENWVIVFPEKLKTVAETFYKELQQQGPRLGINIAIPDGKKIPNDRTESYLKAIKDSVGPDTQFVVTIFPQQRSDRQLRCRITMTIPY